MLIEEIEVSIASIALDAPLRHGQVECTPIDPPMGAVAEPALLSQLVEVRERRAKTLAISLHGDVADARRIDDGSAARQREQLATRRRVATLAGPADRGRLLRLIASQEVRQR